MITSPRIGAKGAHRLMRDIDNSRRRQEQNACDRVESMPDERIEDLCSLVAWATESDRDPLPRVTAIGKAQIEARRLGQSDRIKDLKVDP